MALDAVAARAGVSKGGLLYHFPSKGKLLEGMVRFHLASFEQALADREIEKGRRPNSLMEAYLELFVEDRCSNEPPPTGWLAALAEDPDLLAPVGQHHRELLDRLHATADPDMALIAFLAMQGVRAMQLLNMDVLSKDEFERMTGRLRALLAGDAN